MLVYISRGGGVTAAYPNLKKYHGRIQLSYEGYETFNKLSNLCRNEKRLLVFKKELAKIY